MTTILRDRTGETRLRSPAQPATETSKLRKEVYSVDGEAGAFPLASSVEGHAAETLVQVTVATVHPTRLALHFSDHEVMKDAAVLLCGHTGALKLLERGYTGPLVIRPQLTPQSASKPADEPTPRAPRQN